MLAEDAGSFSLGHKWKEQKGAWQTTGEACDRDPYILFVERCLDMLEDGGRLGIVLPETVFHAPTLGYLRQFLLAGNSVEAIVDLPHNTFRPHCNAKTCLLVVRKNAEQRAQVVMATPREMGHDHRGREIYRPGTDTVWDDLQGVLAEVDDPSSEDNRHVFTVDASQLNHNLLVPRFYRWMTSPPLVPPDCSGVTLGELVERGELDARDGHGSPPSEAKGEGEIPYIRVSDVVNWELYRNPVSGIPRALYHSMVKEKPKPECGDVILVRRGSYRIGTVAMASERDREVLLTRELLVLRATGEMSPFLLLGLLSSAFVQRQIPDLVCYDTTLPNLGDRWKLLTLPLPKDGRKAAGIRRRVEQSVRAKWEAQERIERLRASLGGITT